MSRKSLDAISERRRRDRLRSILTNVPPNLRPLDEEPVENVLNEGHGEDNQEGRRDVPAHVGIHDGNEEGNIADEVQAIFGEDEEREAERIGNVEEWDIDRDIGSSSSESDGESVGDSDEESNYENDEESDAENEAVMGGDNYEDNQPLYRRAQLTVADSMLLILTILVHHNVTLTCLADIIAVINFHCLNEGLRRNSLYKFRKYFSLGGFAIKKHYYCATCVRELANAESVCPSCPKKKNSYFVQLPFLDQIKELYKRDGFYDQLQHRFQRPVNHPGSICDVYDGSVYKAWVENGFLANPQNISFSWYTDGIPVFKSSKISTWPLYLTINELPFADRKRRENTLLAGMWYGVKKPNMNRFLHTFYSDFQRIANGIEVHLPIENVTINVRGIVLTGTCDLPAKCECLNFTQFNGNYGCPTCLCKGISVPLPSGGTVHAYPYDDEIVLRTLEDSLRHADIGTPDAPEMGVKGPTALSLMMPDFVKGVAIDRMHCVDGGIVKKILTLLFDVKYRAYPFSLYHLVNIINDRLRTIKPPKFVHRMPRSVFDLVHWKASELKMWFFYYSIPVFHGVLQQNYFDHYILLVVALSILNSDTVARNMIEVARDLLHKFVREFSELYDVKFSSINVHQLLHLPDCVKNLGPLWAHSCYEYENINGLLLKLIHGTSHIDVQVAKSQDYFIKMTRLVELLPHGNIRDFCLRRKRQVKIIEELYPNCYSVGSYSRLLNLPDFVAVAIRNSGIILQNFSVWQYLRLLKNSKLYVAKNYKENLQTHSYAVQYQDGNRYRIGLVHTFIKIINCNCILQVCHCPHQHYAIVQECVRNYVFSARGDVHNHDTQSFLIQCNVTDNMVAISVESLSNVCVYMNVDNQVYIGVPVNQKELE